MIRIRQGLLAIILKGISRWYRMSPKTICACDPNILPRVHLPRNRRISTYSVMWKQGKHNIKPQMNVIDHIDETTKKI